MKISSANLMCIMNYLLVFSPSLPFGICVDVGPMPLLMLILGAVFVCVKMYLHLAVSLGPLCRHMLLLG